MTALAISGQAWNELREQATTLLASGLLPSSLKKPEQAIAIAVKARELRIGLMQAFTHVHIINGKASMSAELMNALIRRDCPSAVIDFVERTHERCVIKASRHGHEPREFIFTIDDAKRAGLMGNQTWTKYPRSMLTARATSDMARTMFPDCICGVSYVPEELGATVNEDGQVIDIPVQTPAELKVSINELLGSFVDEDFKKVVSDTMEKFSNNADKLAEIKSKLEAKLK